MPLKILNKKYRQRRTQPSVRRKRWRSCFESAFCFIIALCSANIFNENYGWIATAAAFQGTLSSRTSKIAVLSTKARFGSNGVRQSMPLRQRHAAAPLFDTERTDAEMKLSAQIGPSDEGTITTTTDSSSRRRNTTTPITPPTTATTLWVEESSVGVVREVPVPTENGGFTHTSASKAKISAANKGKTPWNKGQARSVEVRERIAAGVRAKNREKYLEKLASLGLTEEEYERQKKDERNRKAAERRARKTENGGYRPTDETRQKISEILKAKWANGEMPRRRMDPSKVRSGFSHSEETRAKISESLRQKWATDNSYRESMLNKTTAVQGNDDLRQKISDTLKAKWQDPDFRDKMMEKIRSRRAASNERDEEYRRKISEAMKVKWQDEEYRNRTTSSIRQRALDSVKVRPPKPPKQKSSKKAKGATNKVRLAQVVMPRMSAEAKRRAPVEVDENGQSIVKAKVKKVKKKQKVAVKMVAPLTSGGDAGMDEVPVKKKVESTKKAKEPDGSINRLRDERRDLYDLLYGDDDEEASDESLPASGIAALLDLEDENLDTFDPYGLEDF